MLENIVVISIVLISFIYSLYTLSSISLKRLLLKYYIQLFGLKMYSILNPKLGKCLNCSASNQYFFGSGINNSMRQ